MNRYFGWLVRHERLVAAATGVLIVVLAVQAKFCKPRLESGIVEPVVSESVRPSEPGGGLTGTWEMSVRKRSGGVQTWTLTLHQNGEALTGVINSEGGDLPVSGTVKGPAINFSAKRSGVTVSFPATFDGVTMTGTMLVLTITRQWTAKRK